MFFPTNGLELVIHGCTFKIEIWIYFAVIFHNDWDRFGSYFAISLMIAEVGNLN
jgi:hypothetical protein